MNAASCGRGTRAGARRAPAADGHRQRDAGLVLRRRRAPTSRRASRAAARCSRRARTCSTSAASPRAATARRCAVAGGDRRASCRVVARARGGGRAGLGRHLQARGRRGGDRGGRGDRQRRLRAARPARWPSVCARDRRGAGAHAHARGAEGDAARSRTPTTTWSPTSWRFLRERMDGRGGARASRRSRSCSTRARTSPRRRRRRSRCCGALDALRALGRPLLLAVSRKDFLGAITGRRGRASAARRRSPRSAAASTRARTILRVHDVAAAADFLAVRAVLRGERTLGPLEGLTPERYPDGARRYSLG